MVKTNTYIHLLFYLIIVSCGRNTYEKMSRKTNPDSLTESLVNANRMHVKRQSDEIDQYVKNHNWQMNVTGTGLRYMIYKNGSGEHALQGKYAKINYKISLLDGTECYSSIKTGPREFLIGQDHVESGLHEGILLMNVGDKALFILPSYMAHGLHGDENKIPPMAIIVYDIELLSLR